MENRKAVLQMMLASLLISILLLTSSFSFSVTVNADKIKSPTVPGTTTTISNAILDVHVEDFLGYGVGTYTISTGSNHPSPGEDVFYDGAGAFPWSTYNTVHVNDTLREYVPTKILTPTPDLGYTLVDLDTCSPTITSTSTKVTITWTTIENLEVIQEIEVMGTTTSDTTVRVTMKVTNNDAVAHTVGIRYEWDLMIDGWDGAWIRQWTGPAAPGTWLDTETDWIPPAFQFWETTNFPTSLFSVYGSVSTPTGATPPDRLVFANWGNSSDMAYSYTPTGIIVGSPEPSVGGQYDSAVLYYWNPTSINPGESKSATAYVTTFIEPFGPLDHDVAITNVKSSKNVVGQSYNLNINVTAANQGSYTETFDVTAYANTTSITTQTVTLASGSSTIITFTWNTTGFAKGNYTISAYATPVPGETDTADNTFRDGTVLVIFPDVNGDGEVDIEDGLIVFRALNSFPGHPRWDPRADINEDNRIDILDLNMVLAISSPEIIHDVAVTNIEVSKTIVGEEYGTKIKVTVENRGTSPENVTLSIRFDLNDVKTGSIYLNIESSTNVTLNVIPRAFLFEEVERKLGGVPTGNIGTLFLEGKGTHIKAYAGNITYGNWLLPAGIIYLYNDTLGTLIRNCIVLIHPDENNTVFTAGKYGEGLYVLGTTSGSLCFLDDKGEFGTLTVGTMPVNDINIEGAFVNASTTNEDILLRRYSMNFTLQKGNYTINAYAHLVPGETYTVDNEFIDSWVIVTILGDLNADFKVNIQDLYIVARAFGTEPGDEYWNEMADITSDGKVNIEDLYIVARNFGQSVDLSARAVQRR